MRVQTLNATYEVLDVGDHFEIKIVAQEGMTPAELSQVNVLRTQEVKVVIGESASFGGLCTATVVKIEE